MKVLHLPSNIASQTSVTVRALRDIGIEARGLVKSKHAIEDGSGIEVLPSKSAGRFSPMRILRKLSIGRSVLSAIRWADVIHWHYVGGVLPMDLDLKYIAFLNKARIVEFWGSDIRIPEIASADNPYTARMYRLNPDAGEEKAERSIQARIMNWRPTSRKRRFPIRIKRGPGCSCRNSRPAIRRPRRSVP
jgi:hypothetical protein